MIGLFIGASAVFIAGGVTWVVYPFVQSRRDLRRLLRASENAMRATELRYIDVPDDPLIDAFDALTWEVARREQRERQAKCSHPSTVELHTIGHGTHEYCQVCGAESEPGAMLDKPSLNR